MINQDAMAAEIFGRRVLYPTTVRDLMTIRLSMVSQIVVQLSFYVILNEISVVAKLAKIPEMKFLQTESSLDQVYPPKNDTLISECEARSKMHCAVLCRNQGDCNQWNYLKSTGHCSHFRREMLPSFTFPCGRDRFWQGKSYTEKTIAFPGKLVIQTHFDRESKLPLKLRDFRGLSGSDTGVISEQNMIWVAHIETKGNEYSAYFNFYFFKLEENKTTTKIYKHFRFKRRMASDTYLIQYHGLYIVRMCSTLLDAFDANTERSIGTIKIERSRRRCLYSLASFHTSLVIVMYETVYYPQRDYRYTFHLYDEDKSSVAFRNTRRASLPGPPTFHYTTTFSGKRPLKRTIGTGCISPRIAISKYGDVAVVMNRFVYLSKISDPRHSTLVERDGPFSSPTMASSLTWSTDGDSLYFFITGYAKKECRAFHQIDVIRNKYGTISNMTMFQYKAMSLLRDINSTSVPYLLAMDPRGLMVAIFEDDPTAVYVYSSKRR